MSVKALTWAWAQELPTATKIVLMALADHADDDGVCWPGMKGVAAKCGINRRNTQRHISRLISLGLMEAVERRRSDNSQTSNLFVLKMGSGDVNLDIGPLSTLTPPLVTSDQGGASPATRGGVASDYPRTVIEPSLEPSPNGVTDVRSPDNNFAESLKSLFREKNKQAALFDIVRQKFPGHEWDGSVPARHIGRLGRILKQYGVERTLRAVWLAETEKPFGDPISLMQAILQGPSKGGRHGKLGEHPAQGSGKDFDFGGLRDTAIEPESG